MTPLAEVLDLARWAPSGDNTQPWRFAIEPPHHVIVFGHDTRAHCVYDLDGHPSQISLGALLETIVIAATQFGLAARVTRRDGAPEERPVFDVHFGNSGGGVDPLARHIRQRTVQRRPLSVRRLSERDKVELERSVGSTISLAWFEGWSRRAKMAWLNFRNAKIRLTLPEAYRVHREVIDWDAKFSESRIPGKALGANPLTIPVMRWATARWDRVAFLNRYLAGTLAPRIELDLVPGLACAAHCVFVAQRAPQSLDDYVEAGRTLQRFWLTATGLGLQFQPQYTPLVFARYARERRRFAANDAAMGQAEGVRQSLEHLLGRDGAARAVFMGRVGYGRPAVSRSLRLPLDQLVKQPNQKV